MAACEIMIDLIRSKFFWISLKIQLKNRLTFNFEDIQFQTQLLIQSISQFEQNFVSIFTLNHKVNAKPPMVLSPFIKKIIRLDRFINKHLCYYNNVRGQLIYFHPVDATNIFFLFVNFFTIKPKRLFPEGFSMHINQYGQITLYIEHFKTGVNGFDGQIPGRGWFS